MSDDSQPGSQEWEGPVERFHIDHGELDGLRRNEVFVLGFEFCEYVQRLASPASFRHLAHSENRDRIQASADRRGRPIRWVFANDDGWLICESDAWGREEG